MAIDSLQFNPYSTNAYFGALTGINTKQAQQTQQERQIKSSETPQSYTLKLKEYSPEDIQKADAIAQALASEEVNEGFFEGLAKDSRDIWKSLTTMFGEPTQEELAQAYNEIDAYSSLKPQNYYEVVDSNNEVIPQYKEEDLYQLVA